MAALAGSFLLPYHGELMKVLDTNRDLAKAARGIWKQMLYSACGTVIGGILLGPIGAMIGGFIGSILGYLYSSNYKSMVSVLHSLSTEEKQELARQVQSLVGGPNISDLTSFLLSKRNREALLNLMSQFVQNSKKNA